MKKYILSIESLVKTFSIIETEKEVLFDWVLHICCSEIIMIGYHFRKHVLFYCKVYILFPNLNAANGLNTEMQQR